MRGRWCWNKYNFYITDVHKGGRGNMVASIESPKPPPLPI